MASLEISRLAGGSGFTTLGRFERSAAAVSLTSHLLHIIVISQVDRLTGSYNAKVEEPYLL